MPVPAIAAAAIPLAKQVVSKVISKEGAKEVLKKFLPFLAKEVAVDGALHLAGTSVAGRLQKGAGTETAAAPKG